MEEESIRRSIIPQSLKCAAADEQNVLGIQLDEFLMSGACARLGATHLQQCPPEFSKAAARPHR